MSLLSFLGCNPPAEPAGAEAEAQYVAARKQMVAQQLAGLERHITNQRVLQIMGEVPRHAFVPAKVRKDAYGDHPLPIGHEQTISQPYIVAFMTQILDPKPNDRVLEIGTGSGYQAAVLSPLVKEVCTIEIVEPLGKQAGETFQRLGYQNIKVRIGDGYQGWPELAPFDAIMVTCAPEKVPEALVQQLKEGGRMIIPVGPFGDQQLHLLTKSNGVIQQREVLSVRFVPMVRGK
jgi:protein-L-isoaspartate(D-aspartate) O-methyltransferase